MLQQIIDATPVGGTVHLPAGNFVVSQAGSAHYCLNVHSRVVRGHPDGTTIVMAPGTAPSVRLFHVTGDSPGLHDLALLGNRVAQTPEEHRHGAFIRDAIGTTIERVHASGFTGDGLYLFSGAVDTTITDCELVENGRNGFTMGGDVAGVRVTRLHAVRNAVQQVDSEPGGAARVADVTLDQCYLDSEGLSNDFVLTMSGTALTQGGPWRVTDCTLNGGVFVVWADNVVLAGNTGVNVTTKPSVEISRSCDHVVVMGNTFRCTNRSVVMAQGTTGSGPYDLNVHGNTLETTSNDALAVRIEGAVTAHVVGNDILAPGGVGVYLRATVPDREFKSAVVLRNTCSTPEHLWTAGNLGATITHTLADVPWTLH